MDGRTVDALFGRDRRSSRPALIDESGRAFDVHWLLTSSWKAGNYLRHTGVHEGEIVGVVGRGPLALCSFFGTAHLSGTTWFDPPTALSDPGNALSDPETALAGPGTALTSPGTIRTLVAPTDGIGRYDLPPGAQRVAYGSQPESPAVHHLEAGLWSENPSFPPLSIDSETPLLVGTDGDQVYSHAAVLDAARAVADEFGYEAGSRVAVQASMSDPRTVAAGVIAPLLVGGVIVLARGSTARSADVTVVREPAESTGTCTNVSLDAVSLTGK